MIKRLLRLVGMALAGCAAFAVVGYAVVYVLSERILRHTYPVPSIAISIPADPASIVEGRRLATIRGCFGGCHGRQADGIVMFDEPMIGRVVAPNLTAAVRQYSDAQLAVLIRHGLWPDGRSTIVMPSDAFVALNDEDLARIIAFLKSLPAAAGPGPGISMGPLGRIGLTSGKFKLSARLIAETIPPPEATGEQAAFGRYLARSICAHCHGTNLRGDSNPDFVSPDLQVVAGYSAGSFARLLRKGVALGGRELPTMSPWSRKHLSYLTDAEISALYSYLHTMPAA